MKDQLNTDPTQQTPSTFHHGQIVEVYPTKMNGRGYFGRAVGQFGPWVRVSSAALNLKGLGGAAEASWSSYSACCVKPARTEALAAMDVAIQRVNAALVAYEAAAATLVELWTTPLEWGVDFQTSLDRAGADGARSVDTAMDDNETTAERNER